MVAVFLSHSSADKVFARRLGTDLRGHGARVWIDEAEIRVGDSLIDKISAGIASVDYLIVVLSRVSCKSEWVRREVNIALTSEIRSRRIKVLPCLIEECDVPLFLIDKKYADFRRAKDYVNALNHLFDALGLVQSDEEKVFLDLHVFYDLTDLNDGFDAPSIKHFS